MEASWFSRNYINTESTDRALSPLAHRGSARAVPFALCSWSCAPLAPLALRSRSSRSARARRALVLLALLSRSAPLRSCSRSARAPRRLNLRAAAARARARHRTTYRPRCGAVDARDEAAAAAAASLRGQLLVVVSRAARPAQLVTCHARDEAGQRKQPSQAADRRSDGRLRWRARTSCRRGRARLPPLRAARCAHSRSETISGSRNSDSEVSVDGSGMAGTVTVWSEFAAAPALAPVGRCRRCQCRAARRRACAIGSGESAARVLLAALRTALHEAPTFACSEGRASL